MRERHDFYTLCPSCETKVELTLAANLQAARAGTSCQCGSCHHEWVCIQEWIYRHESADLRQPLQAPAQPTVTTQEHNGYSQSPATGVPAMQPPRPHLPTFQPAQPVHQTQAAPATPSATNASLGHIAPLQQQPSSNPIPAPHAWSWERQAKHEPVQQSDLHSGHNH